MPSWHTKAAVQGTLSVLPARRRFNKLLQRHVTHSLELSDDALVKRWERARAHVRAWRHHGRSRHRTEGFVAVELGTGWFPAISVGLMLCGAERVRTYDIAEPFDRASVLAVMTAYQRLIRAGRVDPPSAVAEERLELAVSEPEGRTGQELLALLGVDVRVRDARHSGLPDGSVDLVVSTSTLEHLPPDVLTAMFAEFRRIAAVGGVMSHLVDMSDHYAHMDQSISRFNFLRYSQRRWRMYNNPLHYQNRLRVGDYHRLLHEQGWDIVGEHRWTGERADLRRIPVHRDFARFTEDDLLVTSARIVCR